MRQRNPFDRQTVYFLISDLQDMIEKGNVHFQDEQQYHELMDYFEAEFQLSQALEVAEHGIAQFHQSFQLLYRKAEMLLKAGLAEQALRVLDKADHLSPGQLPSYLLRAESLAQLDLHDAALDLLQCIKYDLTSTEKSSVYLQQALVHHELKHYEQAYHLMVAALKANPDNQEVLSRMWFYVEAARKHKESIQVHQEVVDYHPFSALAWYNLGSAYQYFARHTEAIEASPI